MRAGAGERRELRHVEADALVRGLSLWQTERALGSCGSSATGEATALKEPRSVHLRRCPVWRGAAEPALLTSGMGVERNMNLIDEINAASLRDDIPALGCGSQRNGPTDAAGGPGDQHGPAGTLRRHG